MHGCVVSLTGALREGELIGVIDWDYRSLAPFIIVFCICSIFRSQKDLRIFYAILICAEVCRGGW